MENVLRGDIFYANLNPVIGSEQGGVRPVLILQNDIGNKYSPTTIVAAITSRIKKAKLPTHIELDSESFALKRFCDTPNRCKPLTSADLRRRLPTS